MREAITAAMKDAMKAQDKLRLSTLRLMSAAIKERDIEARGAGKPPLGDEELLQVLQKMVKQRQESADIYEQAGRPELAAQERGEIAVIRSFLPEPMDEAATAATIEETVAALGAKGMADMGKVMAALRARYAGRMDFGKASAAVKRALSS